MRTILLSAIYRRNLNGLPVLGTPEAAARRFAAQEGTVREKSDRLAAWYISFCGATGFVFGLPGWLLIPITVPANVAGVAALQMHMVQAIAVLHGRDLRNVETRETCTACLLERMDDEETNTEKEEVAARTGIKLVERGVRVAVGQISSFAGRAARYAALRGLRVSRLPLIGGVLGAGSDAYVTRRVARCAVDRFSAGETLRSA